MHANTHTRTHELAQDCRYVVLDPSFVMFVGFNDDLSFYIHPSAESRRLGQASHKGVLKLRCSCSSSSSSQLNRVTSWSSAAGSAGL